MEPNFSVATTVTSLFEHCGVNCDTELDELCCLLMGVVSGTVDASAVLFDLLYYRAVAVWAMGKLQGVDTVAIAGKKERPRVWVENERYEVSPDLRRILSGFAIGDKPLCVSNLKRFVSLIDAIVRSVESNVLPNDEYFNMRTVLRAMCDEMTGSYETIAGIDLSLGVNEEFNYLADRQGVGRTQEKDAMMWNSLIETMVYTGNNMNELCADIALQYGACINVLDRWEPCCGDVFRYRNVAIGKSIAATNNNIEIDTMSCLDRSVIPLYAEGNRVPVERLYAPPRETPVDSTHWPVIKSNIAIAPSLYSISVVAATALFGAAEYSHAANDSLSRDVNEPYCAMSVPLRTINRARSEMCVMDAMFDLQSLMLVEILSGLVGRSLFTPRMLHAFGLLDGSPLPNRSAFLLEQSRRRKRSIFLLGRSILRCARDGETPIATIARVCCVVGNGLISVKSGWCERCRSVIDKQTVANGFSVQLKRGAVKWLESISSLANIRCETCRGGRPPDKDATIERESKRVHGVKHILMYGRWKVKRHIYSDSDDSDDSDDEEILDDAWLDDDEPDPAVENLLRRTRNMCDIAYVVVYFVSRLDEYNRHIHQLNEEGVEHLKSKRRRLDCERELEEEALRNSTAISPIPYQFPAIPQMNMESCRRARPDRRLHTPIWSDDD